MIRIIIWSLLCIWIGLTLGLYAELERDKTQCGEKPTTLTPYKV